MTLVDSMRQSYCSNNKVIASGPQCDSVDCTVYGNNAAKNAFGRHRLYLTDVLITHSPAHEAMLKEAFYNKEHWIFVCQQVINTTIICR